MHPIYFYRDKQGRRPVADYLDELADRKDKDSRIKLKKIQDYMKILRNYGTLAGEPYMKHLEGDIWELRPIRDRIFFVAWHKGSFVLLHHFYEKDRKDPTARNQTGTARACRSERKRCIAMTSNAIAGTWDEWEKEHCTPEEIAESDLRVALIGELIRARQERGITQKQLEEMSGVTQPVIARLERGTTSPNVSTLMKVLAPLGKKLAIVPM